MLAFAPQGVVVFRPLLFSRNMASGPDDNKIPVQEQKKKSVGINIAEAVVYGTAWAELPLL